MFAHCGRFYQIGREPSMGCNLARTVWMHSARNTNQPRQIHDKSILLACNTYAPSDFPMINCIFLHSKQIVDKNFDSLQLFLGRTSQLYLRKQTTYNYVLHSPENIWSDDQYDFKLINNFWISSYNTMYFEKMRFPSYQCLIESDILHCQRIYSHSSPFL